MSQNELLFLLQSQFNRMELQKGRLVALHRSLLLLSLGLPLPTAMYFYALPERPSDGVMLLLVLAGVALACFGVCSLLALAGSHKPSSESLFAPGRVAALSPHELAEQAKAWHNTLSQQPQAHDAAVLAISSDMVALGQDIIRQQKLFALPLKLIPILMLAIMAFVVAMALVLAKSTHAPGMKAPLRPSPATVSPVGE